MHRDLSCPDIWEHSLERSRARRDTRSTAGRFTRPAAPRPVERDLSDSDLWRASRARSRRRHEAHDPTFEAPARGISVAALLLAGGGSATAIAATLSSGGDAEPADAKAKSEVAAVAKPAAAAADTKRDAAPAERSAVVRTAAAVTAPRPKAKPPGGVAELQKALGIPVDGDFGPKTKKALAAWQQSHGLAADGVAGPQTRAALGLGEGGVLRWAGRPAKPKRSHKRASTTTRAVAARKGGGGVKALQQALGLPADGVFGPATERALKGWQRSHGLTPDGVAGPQTREALGIGAGAVLKRKGGGHRSTAGGGGGSADSSVVARVVAAANAIAGKPYVYGGGHGSFESAGYDCSGSVSYALHGGGLISSPIDSTGFMSYGAPGPGKRITIYANPGHVYMVIDGRRFDTSARSETGSRWTGTSRSGSGYVVRHPVGY